MDCLASDAASASRATKSTKINDTKNIRRIDASHTRVRSGRKEERPIASNNLYQNVHSNLIIIDFKMQFSKYIFDFLYSLMRTHIYFVKLMEFKEKNLPEMNKLFKCI